MRTFGYITRLETIVVIRSEAEKIRSSEYHLLFLDSIRAVISSCKSKFSNYVKIRFIN